MQVDELREKPHGSKHDHRPDHADQTESGELGDPALDTVMLEDPQNAQAVGNGEPDGKGKRRGCQVVQSKDLGQQGQGGKIHPESQVGGGCRAQQLDLCAVGLGNEQRPNGRRF